MYTRKLIYQTVLCLCIIVNFNITSFGEVFEADDTSSFMKVLSEANNSPNAEHTININGDIELDSSVSEAISLELAGSTEGEHYNFSLNGNTFTFSGADKQSKISNLDVSSDAANGGINLNNHTLTVENSNFTGKNERNTIGFLNNNNGTLNINSSTFTGNKNVLGGGAIHNSGTSVLEVADTLISKNTGDNGGGIYFNNGTANIRDSELSGNSASRYGGAVYLNNGEFHISDSSLNNNTSATGGGALFVNNGADMVIEHSNFNKNSVSSGSRGGAIYNNGNLTITNGTLFDGNTVLVGSGGAISNWGTMNIDNAVFENNIAKQDGGAISDSGTLNVTNSVFRNNQSSEYIGGAIASSNNLKIDNCLFDNNSSYEFGGALSIMAGNATISNSIFTNNSAQTSWGGGAVINYLSTIDFNGLNIFQDNSSGVNGGAITATTDSVTNINGSAKFIGNTAEGLGGAIFSQGIVNINAANPDDPVVFSGNKDSTGNNAFHLDIYQNEPVGIGTMNLNVSNGAAIILDDNISGVEGTELNIKGTSSYNDHVYLGAANEKLKSNVRTDNISLDFYKEFSGLSNAQISSINTHFNFMNGYVGQSRMNADLSDGGNSLSIDVDPASKTSDYIDFVMNPSEMTQITIRDINVLSDPVQSVTIFDIFNHEIYGTDLALSSELQDQTVYGALKMYKWALTPKLTLIEIDGYNPNIQRYQGATAAAFMNQMLSYDYSLSRTDEIYTNLRAGGLACRKLNSYAYAGTNGMYVDQYFEDGSAFWMRPYVNIESFHLSGAEGTLNNQSYGTMLGLDFPMYVTKNDWKFFPTIYGAYIGSSQQYLDSNMYQNGGYGGFLLSAYKDDFFAGWTINGGGLGVESKYASGKDDYAIITAGTALKAAYNWKIFNRLILQPNFTTAYTFLSPTNLVNFQSVDMNQSQVNGLTIAPSLRITYRNEEGFEPYIFGGCVIPIMSDIKATADSAELEKLTLNAWAQFGAGVRRHVTDRVTCFAETVIRTGGRTGWGFMFNIQIHI